jgi:hypothetical protein
MRSVFGDVREAPASLTQGTRPPAVPSFTTKEIPYDHVATFTLLGQRGNRVQDVINTSVEGAFVGVAIGYSFIPAPLELPPPPATLGTSSSLPSETIAKWLLDVFDTEPTLPATLVRCLAARVCGIDFKYSVIESSIGRELQNRAIHNLAGLGEASGERPFRPFAKPMLFMPRSTIRIEIEEISEGPLYEGAQLFIVLHGYKILGYGTQP